MWFGPVFRLVAALACALALIGVGSLAGMAHLSVARADTPPTRIIATVLGNPTGVAVDAHGTIYFADGSSRVLKETPSTTNGVTTYTQSTVASNLFHPGGVAVDASSAVYIADFDNSGIGQVLKEMPSSSNGTTTYISSTVASGLGVFGLSGVAGMAVDSSGSVYIADYSKGQVLKEMPSTNATGITTYIPSIVASLGTMGGAVDTSGGGAIAVDTSGAVYITDAIQVRKETPSTADGITTYIPSTIASGLNNPHGVAVDTSGAVYITDSGNNQVLKETPSTTDATTIHRRFKFE